MVTAVNPNWPLVSTQVAFNAGLNSSATPAWTDLTPRMWSFACDRGRQYELDQVQAGVGKIVFDDKDELLNPANTASPYYGGLKPYRQVMVQAQWPPVPVGGAVNLLNATAGYDPDFEATAVGATPPKMLTYGTNPIVQSGGAWSGTKSLQWGVGAGLGEQVAGFTIPCIPGQQYVASVYYRQTAANTAVLFINGGAGSLTSTATGSYVRLSVAFTATQPTHQLWVGSYNPTLAGTVNIDAVQLQPYAPINTNPYFNSDVSGWTPSGCTATWSATRAHEGVGSMLMTPDGVTGTVSVSNTVAAAAAGAAYHVEAWVYCPTGRTAGIGVNWYNASLGFLSSTTAAGVTLTPGTWTLLTLDAIAPASTAYVQLVVSMGGTPAVTDTLNVDQAIVVTPSAFSTTGPVIYGVHRGYVERWPAKWNHKGLYGYAETTTVDGFAALAAKKLHTEYRATLLAKKPDYYWALDEPQGATYFGETSGNRQPPMLRVDAPDGPATFAAGTQLAITGDPGCTGLSTTGNYNLNTTPASFVRAGTPLGTPGVVVGGPGVTGYTVAFWAAHKAMPATYKGYMIMLGNGTSQVSVAAADLGNPTYFYISPGSSTLAVVAAIPGSNGIASISPTDAWNDGKPHLYVVTVDGSTSTMTLYIDGVNVSSGTGPGNASPWQTTYCDLGGGLDIYNVARNPANGGVYAHLALWNRVLTTTDIADLWNVSQSAHAGEHSGTRIGRYLNGNYNGAAAIDLGMSVMGVSNLAEGSLLLDACQAVTVSENGNLWVDGNGVLQFASRGRRYTQTTAQAVFGENESPYEDDIAYDDDPTLVYNDIEVQQTGGVKAAISDATSIADYGPRSYQREINVGSSTETVDAAWWILNTHKDPHQRISMLTIKPSHNPALWPIALGAEIGQRVTVKRRTTAGLTMSSDYFIEQISHDQKPDEWTVQFQLSPAVMFQAGVFDDFIAGVFDQTLVFGY